MSLLRELASHRARPARGVPSLLFFVTIGLISLPCQSADVTVPSTATGQGSRFLGRVAGAATPEGLEVAPVIVSALGAVFGGWGEEASSRLAFVESSLQPAFEVQPKEGGRVAPEATRAVAYSYFAQQHGWLIKGLEPPYMLRSSQELHEVSVLRKAPVVVEALIESQRKSNGLSLGELAAVVTAIERLLVDESVPILEAAYDLNGQDVMDWINTDSLHEILQSYLLLFRQGSHANLVDASLHQDMKGRARKKTDGWDTLVTFESDAVTRFSNLMGGNMELSRQYSFEDVAQIARDLALLYGKWQDVECKSMGTDLRGLDVKGTGKVPYDIFHQQQRNPVYGYQFTEPVDYLRTTGALEEQAGAEPEVLIANYVLGPSNCIATSQFVSVCCLNSCEALASEVWRQIRSPSVEVNALVEAVRNLSIPLEGAVKTADLLQELPNEANDQGKVMLATPAFRQWLHHAFPGRCPSLKPSHQALLQPPTEPATTQPTSSPNPEPSSPSIPPSHRPNVEDCTRMPEYFL